MSSTGSAPANDDRPDGLLAWQLDLYPGNHTKRSTLILHAITSPLFCLGELALIAAIFTTPWVALGGIGIPLALIAQGRAHKGEPVRPVPFRGPGDFVARFLLEQWVTFPRFVLNGGFGKAWRAAK